MLSLRRCILHLTNDNDTDIALRENNSTTAANTPTRRDTHQLDNIKWKKGQWRIEVG